MSKKENTKTYKIIDAVREFDNLIVDARFYESGREVGRIKHSFPIKLSIKELEAGVEKACKLFFEEKEKEAAEKIKAEENKKSQEKIDNLIGKESKID